MFKEHRYRLEYRDADTDELIIAYEGDDLDELYAISIHQLTETRYGVEIDRAKPKPEPSGKQKMIEALAEKYPNAIPIFGGALWIEPNDIEHLVKSLSHVLFEARYRNWHEGLAGACRTFCHLCQFDPMLVEIYIGTTFEDLINSIF